MKTLGAVGTKARTFIEAKCLSPRVQLNQVAPWALARMAGFYLQLQDYLNFKQSFIRRGSNLGLAYVNCIPGGYWPRFHLFTLVGAIPQGLDMKRPDEFLLEADLAKMFSDVPAIDVAGVLISFYNQRIEWLGPGMPHPPGQFPGNMARIVDYTAGSYDHLVD